LHPNVYNQPKKKKKNEENPNAKVVEDNSIHAGLYHRKDGVQLHNSMAVCFHPFMIGYDPLVKPDE
jgi:hypothetical protein